MPPLTFEDFPWLSDTLDVNDCCINQVAIGWRSGSNAFIYITANEGCGLFDQGNLYLDTGQFYCNDAQTFSTCLKRYGLCLEDGTLLWSCDGSGIPATDPNDQNYEFCTGNHSGSGEPVEVNEVACPGDTVALLTPPQGYVPLPNCETLTVTPNDGNIITLPNGEGFLAIASTNTTYTVTRNGIVNSDCYPEPFQLSISTNIEISENCSTEPELYGWLDNLLIETDCCLNQSVIEFPMGGYSFVYVKTGADCSGLGSLYLNSGQLYCSDGNGLDCLAAYGLNENQGNVLWNCDGEPTEPTEPTEPSSIDQYPWLANILNSNDCCENESVIEFSLGSYSFLYIKASDNCSGFGKLYLDNGQLYCSDAANYDCLGAYGLNESDGNVIWNCGGEPTEPTEPTEPVDFEDFPWLNSLIDANDCCTNESVIEFPLGSYSFIYVKTGTNCGGLGTLYLNTGQLYCTDTDNFDCLGAYGLNENSGNVLWTCGTGGKSAADSGDTSNDDLPEQSAKLDNNNSLNNIDNGAVEMKIYPNPSNGLVNISLNTMHEGDQTISVLDLSGRTINEIRFSEAQNQVLQTDLSDLPDGLYLIEYRNANISKIEKIIIRH